MVKINSYKKVYGLLILLWFNFTGFAQIGQNNFKYNFPKPLGNTFLDVSFFDNNNGIAGGNASSFAKTTNGGTTWTYGVVMFNTATGFKQRPTVNDVHFVTASTVYAVGDSGMLLKSTDAGLNWSQVNNPLYGNGRNINAVWFVNKDTGYIGGQAQNLTPTSADSLNPLCSPKLYFTRNGGATWDSINAPRGAMSWVGYVQNNINPPIKVPVNALNKEIYRIQFLNDSIGYIVGSGSGTGGGFPQAYPGTTAGSTVTSTFAANLGGLIWKFRKGVLTDYSLTKEKLGYSGVGVFGTLTTTTTYNTTSLPQQSIKAMVPINDSVLLVNTFNNGMSVRVRTGVNDSTVLSVFTPATLPGALPAITGALTPLPNARGKYEILQYANVPSSLIYNQAVPPVIPAQVLINSNMVNMSKAADGKIYVSSSGGKVGMTANDGTTWQMLQAVPATNIGAGLQMYAVATTPNNKVHVMGTSGMHTSSTDGGVNWSTSFTAPTLAPGLNKMEWSDCNNGVIMGANGLVLATTNAGQTWVDKTIGSFAASFVSIFGMSFPAPNRLYFPASNGNIYFSNDMGTTNNLIFTPATPSINYGMATWGTGATTRIWVTAYRSSAPLAERVVVYRSLNNGITWDTAKQFSGMTATTSNINISQVIKFVSVDTGFMCGPKGHIYKTVNGGTTWTSITPDAPLTTSTLFSGQHSLGVADKDNLIYWTLVSTTRYMYKSTNGGTTWTTNIFPITVANEPVTNIADFVMHDANNFIALTGPNKILITNDGGTTWRFEEAPSGASFTGGQFVPRSVPAGTLMANRKLFLSGNQVLEYGANNLVNVSSSEVIAIPSCTNTTSGSITVNATGSIAPYTYSINGGAYQTANSFTSLATGAYTIRIKTSACDSLVKTINVGFNDNLNLTTSNDTIICAGAPAQLLASSAASTFSWSPAAGLSNANINNPIAIVNSTTAYTVTASLNGCVRTKTVNVGIKPNPNVSAGPDKTIVDGDVVTLDGNGQANVVNIAWTPAATLTGANTFTPIAKPNTTTNYTITVKDNNNCTSTDAVLITVIPYCVKLTDAFTPNGDGTNDKWIVTTGAACTNQIIANVYNRYGSLVYSSENYQNNWDGTYKGKTIPDGTYYYKLTYRLINGKTVLLQGDVTILR
jgi:gliding motility-associated-like protein